MSNAEQKLEAIIRDLTPHGARLIDQLTLWSHVRTLIEEIRREERRNFYDRICDRAEKNMLATGKLEGAHYAAMKVLIEGEAP